MAAGALGGGRRGRSKYRAEHHCGDDDADALEGTLKLVAYLKQKQIPHIFEMIKGLDHDFPLEWQTILTKVLKSI